MDEQAGSERFKKLTLFILALFAILSGRLWQLQVVEGEAYQRMAEGNRIRSLPVRAPRGTIYDRNGEILATNRLAYTVSALPPGLGAPGEEALQLLSEILGVPRDELAQTAAKGAGRPYEPVRLKRDLPIDLVVAIEENRVRLPGIFVENEWVREYPHGPTAGHVLGYLGLASRADVENGYSPTDLVGKSGLEQAYEAFLRGRDGVRRVEVNALNRPVRSLDSVPPEPGLDLHLTLDLRLQRAVDDILARGMLRLKEELDNPNAGAGAAVVLDPRTGDILALASYPALDPAKLSGEGRAEYLEELNQNRHSPWLNRALRAFPPGSTFKVVTAIAALEGGAIKPDTVYNATGRHKYGKADWTIHMGLPPAGPVTIVEAMGRSTNDFFWEIALRPQTGGIEGLARWARRLGFGTPTGLPLPEGMEMAGLVPDPAWKWRTLGQPWYEAETMDVAIGQGFVTATPLQMAQLYAIIAQKGEFVRPRLVRGGASPDGSVAFEVGVRREEPVRAAAETWQALHDGLRAAVQWSRGTAATAFRGAAYDPAGKTGSAQTGRQAHGWFAGYAPADNPEVVVVVFAEYGGSGAQVARIAREIFDAYFALKPMRAP